MPLSCKSTEALYHTVAQIPHTYALGQPGSACASRSAYNLGYIVNDPKLRAVQNLCQQRVASMFLCRDSDTICDRATMYPLFNASYDGCQGCASCQTSQYNKKV